RSNPVREVRMGRRVGREAVWTRSTRVLDTPSTADVVDIAERECCNDVRTLKDKITDCTRLYGLEWVATTVRCVHNGVIGGVLVHVDAARTVFVDLLIAVVVFAFAHQDVRPYFALTRISLT